MVKGCYFSITALHFSFRGYSIFPLNCLQINLIYFIYEPGLLNVSQPNPHMMLISGSNTPRVSPALAVSAVAAHGAASFMLHGFAALGTSR